MNQRKSVLMRLLVAMMLLTGISVNAQAGDQTLRKGGSVVGKIESNGDVRISGSIVGKVESNGDIRMSGSIIGKVEQMTDRRQVAVMYFFDFFVL